MASLVFGALNSKEKKEETSFHRGGSGEQDSEEWDDATSESETGSIFDPPIENYRFTYTANNINQSSEIRQS